MKIALYVAAYHPGNPADYLKSAFESLGHSTQISSGDANAPDPTADIHLLVDSGSPFSSVMIEKMSTCDSVGIWCIDFRHNYNRPSRTPNDLTVVGSLSKSGHIIFQAQYEDCELCQALGISECHWLPLAADPDVWSNEPITTREYDLSFVGNVFDQTRASVIESLLKMEGVKFAYGGPRPGTPGVWKEQAALVLKKSRAGFNINSFYGESYCYDVNMRFYETLSTATPLITNYVPSLERIFHVLPPFLRTYRTLDDLAKTVKNALGDEKFLSAGQQARDFILNGNTYRHRAEMILDIFNKRQ